MMGSEDIQDEIQAAYDHMNNAIDQSRRARHELEHWKTEHDKLSHECARLRLVIAKLKAEIKEQS